MFITEDKVLHFVGCTIISFTVSAVFDPIAGFFAGYSTSTSRELYKAYSVKGFNTEESKYDLIAAIAGSVVGTVLKILLGV